MRRLSGESNASLRKRGESWVICCSSELEDDGPVSERRQQNKLSPWAVVPLLPAGQGRGSQGGGTRSSGSAVTMLTLPLPFPARWLLGASALAAAAASVQRSPNRPGSASSSPSRWALGSLATETGAVLGAIQFCSRSVTCEGQQSDTRVTPRLAVAVAPALLAVSPSSLPRACRLSGVAVLCSWCQVRGAAVSGFPALAMSFGRGTDLTGQRPLSSLWSPLSAGCWGREQLLTEV